MIRFYQRRQNFFVAFIGTQIVGRLELDETNSFAEWVWTAQGFRRQGIASQLYDFAESKIGRKLIPSECLSRVAEKFWENRLCTKAKEKSYVPSEDSLEYHESFA